jgi:hypothetical protein
MIIAIRAPETPVSPACLKNIKRELKKRDLVLLRGKDGSVTTWHDPYGPNPEPVQSYGHIDDLIDELER